MIRYFTSSFRSKTEWALWYAQLIRYEICQTNSTRECYYCLFQDTRTHVVVELYDTERSYVEALQILVNVSTTILFFIIIIYSSISTG